ncbi:MAG: VCBS repeat-containing protein [Verrucomicrobiales bacterium]|nr:VCBS repeat-containing protein [Verrucomicrobiales bacterium]
MIPRIPRARVAALCAACCLGSGLVLRGAPAPEPRFRATTVDPGIAIGYGLAIADVDGDRRLDLVLADKQVIAWYRNPDWTKHVIAERLTELDHVCIAAADIDGDGKAEVAAGAGWNPGDTIGSGALFYLSPPADRTQRWEPIRLAHDPTIHRIRWARWRNDRYDLLSLPLHGRGNKNGEGDGVRFLAYHKPADVKSAWTTTQIQDRWHAAHNFDVFRDPGQTVDSVFTAAREGIYRVDGAGAGRPVRALASSTGTPEFAGAGEVRAGRVGDRVAFAASIEPMHGPQVVVYQPRSGDSGDGLWERRVIDGTLVDGHGLACGDLLGLGRDQIVAGWRAMNRPGSRVGIRLYVPEGDRGWDRWTTHVIDDNAMACEDLQLADLDGDGDLDLAAAGRATRNVVIYWNERLP